MWGLRGGDIDDVGNFQSNLPAAAAAGAKHIMGFNEPDQYGGGGSGMTVAAAQAGWKANLAQYHGQYTLVSPGVTNTENDPNKGLEYMTSFLSDPAVNSTVDKIAIHWYGGSDNNIEGATSNLLSQIDNALQVGNGRGVWLTEFAYQGTDEAGFMANAFPQLDSKAGLERYSYNLDSGPAINTLLSSIAST